MLTKFAFFGKFLAFYDHFKSKITLFSQKSGIFAKRAKRLKFRQKFLAEFVRKTEIPKV